MSNKTEEQFLDEYNTFYREGYVNGKVFRGASLYVAEQKNLRLDEKEIEYEEKVTPIGNGRIETKESETYITKMFTIERQYKRHGRIYYKEKDDFPGHLLFRDGECESFFVQERFTASVRRYMYIAMQVSVIPVMMRYMQMPKMETGRERLLALLTCIAIVLPIMFAGAYLICKLKQTYEYRRRIKDEENRNKVDREIVSEFKDLDILKVRADLQNQIKTIHFCDNKKELEKFGCENIDKLIAKYKDVCDASLGAVTFTDIKKTKLGYRISLKAEAYMLVDTIRNLAPKKERLIITLNENMSGDFRIVSYKRGR